MLKWSSRRTIPMTCPKSQFNKTLKCAAVDAFSPEVATLARRLVRQHLLDCSGFQRTKRQFLAKLTSGSACSPVAADCMVDVIHLTSLVAAQAVIAASPHCKDKKVRMQISPVLRRLQKSDSSSLRAKLARSMRKWRNIGDHDRQLTAIFSQLCKQE